MFDNLIIGFLLLSLAFVIKCRNVKLLLVAGVSCVVIGIASEMAGFPTTLATFGAGIMFWVVAIFVHRKQMKNRADVGQQLDG